jgi:hypothetical protein
MLISQCSARHRGRARRPAPCIRAVRPPDPNRHHSGSLTRCQPRIRQLGDGAGSGPSLARSGTRCGSQPLRADRAGRIILPAYSPFPRAAASLPRCSVERKLQALPCSGEFLRRVKRPGSGATFWYYYIFRIATYRRTSDRDLTATSASAAAAAAMVIAVTYPSVRITFPPALQRVRDSGRDIDVPHPGAGSTLRWRLPPPRPGSLPACGRPSYLAAVLATAVDENVSLRITASNTAAYRVQ